MLYPVVLLITYDYFELKAWYLQTSVASHVLLVH